jgi:hypothetical protein
MLTTHTQVSQEPSDAHWYRDWRIEGVYLVSNPAVFQKYSSQRENSSLKEVHVPSSYTSRQKYWEVCWKPSTVFVIYHLQW